MFVQFVSFMLCALAIQVFLQAFLEAVRSILLPFAEFMGSFTESFFPFFVPGMFSVFVFVPIHEWPHVVFVGILTAGKGRTVAGVIQRCWVHGKISQGKS
jgi:hypothetical protein